MGQSATHSRLTRENYLAWETAQAERHELINGEPYAMAGAEDRHVTVSLNLAMALRQHLAGSPCRTYMADMKLEVAVSQSFFYPDVLVTCSEADRTSALVKREPVLVVEVLSLSTAAFDRGGKFAHYRQLTSLKEYVLVDLDSRRTDVYRPGADGLWVLHPFEPLQPLELASVGLSITPEVLWAEVDEPPPPSASS
jgi:Uma2 family endonuclease